MPHRAPEPLNGNAIYGHCIRALVAVLLEYIVSLANMERMICLHLLVISLSFSHLIASCHAVPSARAERMLTVARELLVLIDAIQITSEDELVEEAKNRRMDLETNDYPGSAANYRHTPKPPE